MTYRSEYSHAYYMSHREHILEYSRIYRQKHRETYLKRAKEWHKAHPLETSEIHRRYYERNKERLRAAARNRYWKRKREAMSE